MYFISLIILPDDQVKTLSLPISTPYGLTNDTFARIKETISAAISPGSS